MTASEIRQQLPLHTPSYFSDSTYAKPTLRWLLDTFYSWFWETRTSQGLRIWTRKNDCDNFARAYAQAAQDCHSLSSDSESSDEGLAVGQFWYYQKQGTAHAICIAFTDVGRVFIEPQTGKQLFLTDSEINSCFLAQF